jgi:hypothetical protein
VFSVAASPRSADWLSAVSLGIVAHRANFLVLVVVLVLVIETKAIEDEGRERGRRTRTRTKDENEDEEEFGCGSAALCCIADWQSASARRVSRAADCQSAIQQVANLRYEPVHAQGVPFAR